MKSLTASYLTLLFACALLQSCSMQSKASPRTVASSPAPDSLEEFVRQTYLKAPAEYEVDGVKKVSESREPANRFRSLGEVRTAMLLPDRAFCNDYVTLSDGMYCYRHQRGEPFQIRRVDAFSMPEAKAADQVLQNVLGQRYRKLRPLLIVYEYIETPRVRCVSFEIYQKQILSKDAVDANTIYSAPTGQQLTGLGCLLGGKPYAVIDEWSATSPYSVGRYDRELWDVFTHQDQEYLLVLNVDPDAKQFQAFAVSELSFSQELKRLIKVLDLTVYDLLNSLKEAVQD
jgi:hypothetical protein